MSGILLVVELVKVKAHTRQSGPLDFEDLNGKTMVSLLRTTKSYFATGRYVILDSGFCVLKGLIWFMKKGIFACAVIKKIRYCPYMVLGKDMEDNFGEVEVEVEVGEKY